MRPDQLSTEQIHQHFPAFSEPGLQQVLSDQGRLHHFAEGELIMDFGGTVRMLPLILTGSIKISRLGEDGSELFLYYLTRGETCTMTFTCCISSRTSEIRAVAEEDTTVLGLPPQRLDEWMMRYVSWKNFVMQSYDRRLGELLTTIDQIAFQQVDSRLLEYLTRRAELRDDRALTATHQEIANDLHVSRETISRLLKSLEKRGLIALGRNRITLRELV